MNNSINQLITIQDKNDGILFMENILEIMFGKPDNQSSTRSKVLTFIIQSAYHLDPLFAHAVANSNVWFNCDILMRVNAHEDFLHMD